MFIYVYFYIPIKTYWLVKPSWVKGIFLIWKSTYTELKSRTHVFPKNIVRFLKFFKIKKLQGPGPRASPQPCLKIRKKKKRQTSREGIKFGFSYSTIISMVYCIMITLYMKYTNHWRIIYHISNKLQTMKNKFKPYVLSYKS